MSIKVSYSQNYIDSLQNAIKLIKEDSSKISTIKEIGSYYINNEPDSAIYYNEKIIKIAQKYNDDSNIVKHKATAYMTIGYSYYIQKEFTLSKINYIKAISFFKKLEDNKRLIQCYGNLANDYLRVSNYDSAIVNYNNNLNLSIELNDSLSELYSYINIGTVYLKIGEFEKALAHFINSLKISEKLKDEKLQSVCLNSIGVVYWNMQELNTALDYFNKSVALKTKINDKKGISACLLNMGLINTEKKEFDEAIYFYEKSLNLKLELNDIWGAGKCYNNIGNAYQHKKEYKKSIEYYKKALEIKIKYEDNEGIALVKASIAELFLTMANNSDVNSTKKKYYKESIRYGLEAYSLAKQLDTKQWIGLSTRVLSKSYKKIGSYKESVKYLEIYLKNDSIMFSDEKTKAITEMEAKYKSEKKQLEIEKLEKDKKLDKEIIARQEAENKKQNIILFSFIIGFILIFILAIVIFYFLRQKRKANILLAYQKQEISEKNEELNQLVEEITTQRDEITAQKDEIEAQRDKVVTQKEIIEKIHLEVSESIDYATKIQQSILPEKEILAGFISEYFVLYKPKDKVSGDFYWWNQINGQTIITAADCTGHGVPGAFMSMLGVSFLREILQKEHITYPGIILKKLRKEIIKALKQKGEIGGQKDGMDMAIISINHETNVLQYAGANNPLYIVKNKELKIKDENTDAIKLFDNSKLNIQNSKLFYEVRPDKMPISIYYKMDDFNTHEIQLEKGDQLYLFSDGYVDQFGGEKGSKFKSKAFKKLLLENANKPMQEQKEILNAAFLNWKGDIEQIDDVTVLGIKI